MVKDLSKCLLISAVRCCSQSQDFKVGIGFVIINRSWRWQDFERQTDGLHRKTNNPNWNVGSNFDISAFTIPAYGLSLDSRNNHWRHRAKQFIRFDCFVFTHFNTHFHFSNSLNCVPCLIDQFPPMRQNPLICSGNIRRIDWLRLIMSLSQSGGHFN